MKKVSRKSITQEYLFEAEDGTTFSYEGQAVEHDINLAEKELEKIKKGDINIPELNLIGSIYKVRNAGHMNLINKYCDLKGIALKDIDIPSNIIVTDSFVLSAEALKNLVEEASNL